METLALSLGLIAVLGLAPMHRHASGFAKCSQAPVEQQRPSGTKQLLAIRGEVVKVASQSKGLLSITIRPARDYAEVTVVARENDSVGLASGHERGGSDLLGIIGGADDSRDNERITARELQEGDIVSVIYNPLSDNRALEIYLH
jgi:hypothetical protein